VSTIKFKHRGYSVEIFEHEYYDDNDQLYPVYRFFTELDGIVKEEATLEAAKIAGRKEIENAIANCFPFFPEAEENTLSLKDLTQFDIKPGRHTKIVENIAVWIENGEVDYYSCQLPIAKNGDRIEIGATYEVDDEDTFLVTGMKLVDGKWVISGVLSKLGNWDLRLYDIDRKIS
jgi:hypothetical protein